MTTEIVPFDFNGAEVRTLVIDGEPWWVAADVARALGITNGRNMVARLDGDEKDVRVVDTLGGPQSLTIISESGLYSAIVRSDSIGATRFRMWVTREVLPEIRRTGSYTAPETPEQLLARALTVAQGVLDQKTEQIEALTPRAEAWDELASAQGDYDVAEAAKILARAGVVTGPQRLFDQLAALRWTFRSAGTGKWEPYAASVDSGYLAAKPQSHHHPRTGAIVLDPPQVRVTLKGIERLRIRLTNYPKAEIA
ncbi:MAG: phage antirepressor KilAC domain-containing protein [Kineosporiaceae bacterium]|nr:phage antirepressor KilAC domain-containing protein [Aeromicrobium sp.]